MKKYTVAFIPVGSPDRDDTKITNVIADNAADARCRAIAKCYGKNANWEPNRDLGNSYGQISRSIRGADHRTCITGRMRCDICHA